MTMRILIVDDHPVFRQGLRALIDSEEGTRVVGEAASGEEAIAQIGVCRPDLVLMDVHMPEMDGVEATRHILRAQPRVQVVMLTMIDDPETILSALRAGARGYLLKDAEPEEIATALAAVARGELVFSASIARELGDQLSQLKVLTRARVRDGRDAPEPEVAASQE